MVYRIVGVINLVFALPQTVIPLLLFLITVPEFDKIYHQSFGVSSVSLMVSYLAATLLLFMGAANAFFGVKLFSHSKTVEHRYFKYALVSIVLTLLLVGWLMGIMLVSLIIPIYHLSTLK